MFARLSVGILLYLDNMHLFDQSPCKPVTPPIKTFGLIYHREILFNLYQNSRRFDYAMCFVYGSVQRGTKYVYWGFHRTADNDNLLVIEIIQIGDHDFNESHMTETVTFLVGVDCVQGPFLIFEKWNIQFPGCLISSSVDDPDVGNGSYGCSHTIRVPLINFYLCDVSHTLVNEPCHDILIFVIIPNSVATKKGNNYKRGAEIFRFGATLANLIFLLHKPIF